MPVTVTLFMDAFHVQCWRSSAFILWNELPVCYCFNLCFVSFVDCCV